jgi:hypothetical protein
MCCRTPEWLHKHRFERDEWDKINHGINQRKYLNKNEALLKSQTEVFYNALIAGIDPDLKVTDLFS